MLFPILSLIVALVFVPAYLLYALWQSTETSRYGWLLRSLHAGGWILFFFLIGSWNWFSYYLRYAWAILFLIAAYRSYRRLSDLPFFDGEGRRQWFAKRAYLFEFAIVLAVLVYTFSGFFYGREPVALNFPLQDGWYYVAQGGGNFLLNRHAPSEAQRYALDVVEINHAGIRADGLYPADLDRYVIFGKTLFSPCSGDVVEALDGLEDNIPPATNREQLAGNHVVIRCRDVNVLLAHMRNGSVMVEAGDTVAAGQPLGAVGNSGNTTEPHLHIHAVREDAEDILAGEGVPMRFEGVFPVRNTVFFRR